MNRVAAIASAVTVLAFANTGRAESLGMNAPTSLERTLQTFNSTDFRIQHLSDQVNVHDIGGPRPFAGRSVADKEMIQAAISSNGPLVRRLGEQGVRVQDIVNADEAVDDSITIYHR